MIICDQQDWGREKYALHPIIHQAIDYISTTDFTAMATGKYDIIPGKMFCLLQEFTTEPADERLAESHFKFVDIQYLLQGEETIGVARGSRDNTVIEDKSEHHDIVFYRDIQNESFISLTPGMFAVFFPEDLHRPCCQSQGQSFIRKAVIKIHISLFTDC
ncbi:YhcH/YjgK/YiaL family protein [Dickeya dadantii]|uniref:YhcH/YjgK/YiaL family protein n=1 Tax=Dickeya dadantii TaxID=204038 RepID=UPI001C0C5125|nr:YhcH/YjgK/YiaL family protein [Dickeya dadantii]QWT42411.1 YhcH/YjgK/YiaL family protein [Dickeya dadantii]